MKYFPSTYIVMIFLLLYVPLSLYSRFRKTEEIFPFFSWNLFYKTPSIINEYKINLKPSDKTRGTISSNYIYSKYTLVQKIGYFYTKGDIKDLTTIRKIFEADYTQGVKTYTLLLIRYDPYTLWTTGKYNTVKKLVTFSTGIYD